VPLAAAQPSPAVAPEPEPESLIDLPTLPEPAGTVIPVSAQVPAPAQAPARAQAPAPTAPPAPAPVEVAAAAPERAPAEVAAVEPLDLPPVAEAEPAPAPAELPAPTTPTEPAPAEAQTPAEPPAPAGPVEPATTPATPAPAEAPPAIADPRPAPAAADPIPAALPELPPELPRRLEPAPPAPGRLEPTPAPAEAPKVVGLRAPLAGGSTLSEASRRAVEEVALRQEAESRRATDAAPTTRGGGDPPSDGGGGDSPANRLELPRAPSPTEARPIRPIPVPEEFTPMGPRRWDASRKFWAAPATCHGPLYFQDAVLERYGQSVEQALGPAGRFLSYPLDDPKQSNQRMQILQPAVSLALFYGQVLALPYNLIVDPPWEAEYDLGYHRPGDRIPPDTYYLPWLGVGPPFKGRNYAGFRGHR